MYLQVVTDVSVVAVSVDPCNYQGGLRNVDHLWVSKLSFKKCKDVTVVSLLETNSVYVMFSLVMSNYIAVMEGSRRYHWQCHSQETIDQVAYIYIYISL